MALNQIYANADSLSYNLGAVDPAIVSGEFVVIGGIVGVAETDAALRADGNYWVTLRHVGVFAGTTADAVAVGDALYIAAAATNGTALTTTATGNELVGYAIAAKGAVAGDVWVRVNN
jgi:predicted RecA/RadA family phage recombinase